jgi:hypothetical protein
MSRFFAAVLLCAGLALPAAARAQYTAAAGRSAPMDAVESVTRDAATGKLERKTVYVPPKRDPHGNAHGSKYDLAVDGAFEGQTIAVLHFYTGMGFDFSLPRGALAEKGFSVYRWIDRAPSPEELARGLEKANQLWIISGDTQRLNERHVAVIKKFFDAGHGVYIWGDNPPYVGDANLVARALLDGAYLTPDAYVQGEKVVGMQEAPGKPGLRPNHLITTGLEHLYEGHTIPTIVLDKKSAQSLEPLIVGSAGNLVAASYDRGGKRAILDGGFTRLYMVWDTAGTARYVKNAAAWLANAERFGAAVVAKSTKQ